ncbi:golgin subfamily A member 6-like protein 22 [Vespa crabro]|uniref:golgin subfamily A member 6-like protein 22 n=1 Tax=Vespa crabro TaxID=7445 RepID=UPI001F019217|nr:golgin subfamily A member 6-like protein 22 [Vespa crabro]XP_046837296.1 golgin subfamily A member 6-like protein 22 [Vespa crabro]
MPGAGGQPPQQRTTFRPPWVKDGGPNPLPMPTAPWTLNSRRDSKSKAEEPPAFTKVTLKSVSKPTESVPQTTETGQQGTRKQSKITIIPSQPKSEKNLNAAAPTAAAAAAAATTTTKTKTTSSTPPSSKPRENGRQEPNSRPQLERQVRIERSRSRGDTVPLSKSESSTGAPTLSKSSSRAAIPPPPPPRPPPPPPSRSILKDIPPLTEGQEKQLEMLKSRPRKRPDWASMMKEVESGKRLRHVKCNDRSAPLIERVNKVTADPAGKAHFVFESEKSNMHNQLLKQIQQGVKLKSVKTNDRSKPILEGLRKFRRQLTIEEQMQKVEAEDEPDDVIDDDDIDAVRDDLQSTKQMLAIELRNKEALERENKRLQARILNLEAEVERTRSQKNVQEYKQQEEKLTESLKEEARAARKDVERLEKEYANTAEERDKYKNELEEMKRIYNNLEKRMKAGMALAGCPSAKDVARIASQKNMENKQQDMSETEEELEEEEEESTEEEDEEDSKASTEKRLQREIKLLSTKVKNFMDKAVNARKERHALKEQIKQQQKLLKEEKRKFKHLQKEVDKMAKLMADADGDDEEEEEEDEETESEESESEESEEEEESEIDEIGHTIEQEKDILQKRVKRHENRLAALKKGNYLLKAQVDRLKDDLAKQREESITLQEDLDSVLAELG